MLITALLLLQASVADTGRATARAQPAVQPIAARTVSAARTPAFAPDGRLVVAVDGDLWLRLTDSAPFTHLTQGAAWDRDPAFTRDGTAILFASDRGDSGDYDIYRLELGSDGTPGSVSLVVRSPEWDVAPADAGDGALFFVRGHGATARIWRRDGTGVERPAHAHHVPESTPLVSPDGQRYAYIASAETGRYVVVRSVSGGDSSVANSDRGAERLAWAPDGERLAIGTRTGTYVVARNGRYTNFLSTRRGDLAWSPAAPVIAIAELDDVVVGYNGDPDRRLDRSASERFAAAGTLYFLDAPAAPDHGLAAQPVVVSVDRAQRNAGAFDRLWERTTRLYFTAADAATRRAAWDRAHRELRARAVAAQDDDALQAVMHELLRRRPPLRVEASGRAAVSSAHPVATEAGLAMLRAGGNVVDAAVAVSFALGVVEPDASGIGGYGQMVIALRTLPQPTLIEFMSRVPENAPLSNTSLLRDGRYPPDGPALTNVPGTVAGMFDAWRKYGSGKLTWAQLLAPAIHAARNGYEVSDGLATTLATEREHFSKYEGSRALFFRDGKPLVSGDTIRNVDLAWVLEQVAARGADGFYRGDVAQRYVTELRAHGNAMKASDLERYFAPERAPVRGTYRGYTIYSSAPPVSGGAELVGRLNLLEQFPNPRLYTEDAATLHAALSAWFLVPSARGRVADPALWPVDIAPIVDKDTARTRWSCFDNSRALQPSRLRGAGLACAAAERPRSDSAYDGARHDSPSRHASGTTAFTVADNNGNVVSVTQTLGTWGGNFHVTPGLGFLSNDKLTSYGTDSTQYGSRLPFARHGSTIAPTIVYRGNTPVFAIGAAGNAWITSAIYQGMIAALDFGLGPQQVLELPRFLPSGGRGGGAGPASDRYTIQMEDGFSPAVIARLRELGYEIDFVSMRGELREGYGAAIRIDGDKVTAGADPRRSGQAGAIR